ncbi:glycoside hydrolase family 2 TIM barrel-domain containing protein [Pontibacter vulgaris]|uniref:glycoside hydrolase family 2 TIM barrel-domain containing protein n=1 Tax=Pontibacter vulgaris TaxID=2905679 RepID=UPI001FA6FC39|nr:glycoside hydrolase family 2 TIM barrel-domain containing protein [Pontibacter vulgaris]
MNIAFFWLIYTYLLTLPSLSTDNQVNKQLPTRTDNNNSLKVEVRKVGDKYSLYRGGKPYYIKGAAGSSHLSELKRVGGNSIRTWHTEDAQQVLDSAYKNGITVTLGLTVRNYKSELSRRRQLRAIKRDVRRYKDHPALLMWAVGNEVHQVYPDIKAWLLVNELAGVVKAEDPNHPTTTTLAGYTRLNMPFLRMLAPNLDIISINAFNDLKNVAGKIKNPVWGWDGAYIVSEWGPPGYWEDQEIKTPWNATVEKTSTEKAILYRQNYSYIQQDAEQCIGSYVFYWGKKQERTPTLFSMFTAAGNPTEAVDAMQQVWTGKPPADAAPHIKKLYWNGSSAISAIYTKPGAPIQVQIETQDDRSNQLAYTWEIRPEGRYKKDKYNKEIEPAPVWSLTQDKGTGKLKLQVPEKEGPYRLYIYVTDASQKVATGNIPFFVRG